jgi:DNA mismatch repair protein MutS2
VPRRRAGGRGDGFRCVEGRHPLLLAQGIAVVPFDLAMAPGRADAARLRPQHRRQDGAAQGARALFADGAERDPRAGGARDRLPCFDDVFADIGDEQSLEASLSTFSAHLKHLTAIIERASSDALVLVDELGSGTDPLEGAALGGAILEELTRRGTTTIATTHLGALKELASEVPGVVNASLQFDAERLAPTYRLIKGIPGRSYGLAIAQRLNMPAQVLRRAEERVPQMERDLSALLADVEKRAAALGTREKEVAEQQEDLQYRAAEGSPSASACSRRRSATTSASSGGTRGATCSRRARKSSGPSRSSRRPGRPRSTRRRRRRAAPRDARGRGAGGPREARGGRAGGGDRRRAARADAAEAETADARGVALAVGDAVAVGTLGGKIGKLLDVRGNDAVVAVGAMKLTVPFDTLRRMSVAAPEGGPRGGRDHRRARRRGPHRGGRARDARARGR